MVQKVRNLLAEYVRDLKAGERAHKGPFPLGYKPELDLTDEYDLENQLRCQ